MDGDNDRDFIELAKSHHKMDTSYFKLCAMSAALISIAEDTRRVANTLEDSKEGLKSIDDGVWKIEFNTS